MSPGGRPGTEADLALSGFADATEIGRGGFGVVYRCREVAIGRTVAVKLLHTDLDPASRARFFREGRAMGGLSGHPNVVDVLHVGESTGGRLFIVMPFLAGGSLSEKLQRDGPVPWPDAVRMGVRLCGALESAHRLGTLHRDVKPANVLLSDYGEAQLTDFGIARIQGGFETMSGAFTGSVAYSPPDIMEGAAPSPRSDVYGLAAALFTIIAGEAAFARRPDEEIVAQYLRIRSSPVPDLRGDGVPDDLCTVLEQAMAKSAEDRPATAQEFGRALQDVQRRAGRPVSEMATPAAVAATTTAQGPPDAPREPRPGTRRGTRDGAGPSGTMPDATQRPVPVRPPSTARTLAAPPAASSRPAAQPPAQPPARTPPFRPSDGPRAEPATAQRGNTLRGNTLRADDPLAGATRPSPADSGGSARLWRRAVVVLLVLALLTAVVLAVVVGVRAISATVGSGPVPGLPAVSGAA